MVTHTVRSGAVEPPTLEGRITYDVRSGNESLSIDFQGTRRRVADLGGSGGIGAISEQFTVTNQIGGWANGTVISVGTAIENIIRRMLNPVVAPTYVAPTLTLAGTQPLAREIGEQIMPVLTPTWTLHDGGAMTQYRLSRGGTVIFTSGTATAFTDAAFYLLANTTYQAAADHGQGPIKNDSEGDPHPEGRISAGTRTSGNVTYIPQRRAFFGGLPHPVVPDSSAQVRGISNTLLNPANNTVMTATATVGARGVCFAYPATLRAATSIMQQSLNMNVLTGFTETTVTVEGANGHLPVAYRVYYVIPEFPFASEEVFVATI